MSLPAAVGTVTPPNTAALKSAAVVYSPPVCHVSLAPTQPVTTPLGHVEFEVAFTSTTVGLTASSITVDGGGAVVVSRSLVRHAADQQRYSLVVALLPRPTADAHPHGSPYMIRAGVSEAVLSALTPPATGGAPAVALYAPPVPTIAVDHGQALVSHEPTLVFSATFSARITGLAAEDFVVHVGGAAEVMRALSGNDRTWLLNVTVDPSPLRAGECPVGYTAYDDHAWCARKLVQPHSWDSANAACSPYSLASVLSARQMELGEAITSGMVGGAWYVESYVPAAARTPTV